jgi:DNA polymerase-3 subunit alpha
MSFVPLHIYSGFSYLQSGLIASNIPLIAKKLGYSAVGISDKNSLSGLAPFDHSCLANSLKPIFGMDLEINEGLFSLYVLNEKGYRHLLRLTFLASEQKATLKDLVENQDGLSIIYNPSSSFLDELKIDVNKAAQDLSLKSKGLASLMLGLPYLKDDVEQATLLRDFASSHSYPLVAFPHIIYEKKTDAIVTLITKAIDEKTTLTTKSLEGKEYFLSLEDVQSFYTKSEIQLSEDLASKVNFTYIEKRGTLLHFANNEDKSSEDYLAELALKGLSKRLNGEIPPLYLSRLNYELSIINKMGYADYFLLVSDYVNFAKTHQIAVGPGRGSGPASLVAFALSISLPDPIKNNLLFERFLNPERKSMPDIDVDFSDTRREEVVAYLQNKYGVNKVSHILTTQTIGAKEALRDIGRVYLYEDREINLIISSIINDKLSLRDDYRTSPQFKQLINSDKYYLEIVSLASKIEGLPRQAGLHAAAVVLNDEPLEEVLPIKNEESIGYVACLEKDYLEEQGFLKMDLLGLRNLSTIDTCLALIEKDYGKKLSYEDLPYDDTSSIELIKKGKTMGLFQLESPGMKRAIREVEPTTFNDVAALLALFRPGPMESIPSYARRKKGLEKVTYLSSELEDILKSTYGIIVYQEQIMQIVQKMAGFSLGEADLFRRAISKKDANKLKALKDKFMAGCLANHHSSETSLQVFNLIFKFANYGFNKAHAVSYAVLSCQMAYLKKNYPQEFYCAILDALSPSQAKFKDTIAEAKDLHLSLALPSLNHSSTAFLVYNHSLLLPFSAIKGLQSTFINSLIDERNLNGPFLDFFDFASRMKHASLSLPLLIKLIDAGVFDEFTPSRATLRASAPSAMNYAEMTQGINGQEALLAIGLPKPHLIEEKDDLKTNLGAEYEMVGLMISGSPLSLYKDKLEGLKALTLSELEDTNGSFLTRGLVKSVRVITTRQGSQMAFLEVYDETSEASFVVFSDVYLASYQLLKDDNAILIRGYKDPRKDGYLAKEITSLGETK